MRGRTRSCRKGACQTRGREAQERAKKPRETPPGTPKDPRETPKTTTHIGTVAPSARPWPRARGPRRGPQDTLGAPRGPPKQCQTKTQRPLTAPNKNPKTLNKKRRKINTIAREYVRAPRPHHIQTQRADRDEPVDASTSEGVSRTAAGALQPTVTCAKICFCTPTHGSKGVQAIYAPPLPATTSNAAQHHAPDTTEHIKA